MPSASRRNGYGISDSRASDTGMIARYWKWVLLACAPIAFAAEFLEWGAVPVFVFSALAVIPLAAFIGESTGHLAHHLGPSSGALINATFGNLAEMIIAG